MGYVRWAIVLVAFACGAARADGSAGSAGSAAADEDPNILTFQVKTTIGIHIIALRDIDLRAGTFYAEFYYWMLRQSVHDAAKDKLIETVEFMNGSVTGNDQPIEAKDVGPDLHYACWRAAGTFHFAPDMRRYPFDSQSLEIQIENPDLERQFLVYSDDTKSYERSGEPRDRWGLKSDVNAYQYDIARVERGESVSTYHTDFGDPKSEKAKSDYSRFTVRILLVRQFGPYFLKILLPLLVIVAVAYLVFWLPPREIGTASSLGITALLSCIAFQISIAQSLPDVGYMMTSDKLFIVTYLMIFSALAQSIWSHRTLEHGDLPRAERWVARGRVVFPIVYVVAMGYLFVEALVFTK